MESRGQIPHAFAYQPARRSVSSASGKRQVRASDVYNGRDSPLFPMSEDGNDDPTSPITPLWAMGSFVTSSSFSRTPDSVVVGLGSGDWHTKSKKKPTFPLATLEFTPMEPVDELCATPRRHRRERASTDSDNRSSAGILSYTRSHKTSKQQSSRLINMTATNIPLHQLSRSQGGTMRAASMSDVGAKRTSADKRTSSDVAPLTLARIEASVPSSVPRIGTLGSTTQDELTSMAEAAEMALRRRTRSAPFKQPLESSSPSSSDYHRRSASLGGERLEPSVDRGSKLEPASSKRSPLRSPPPPPLLAPPPSPVPIRPPPPTRSPPRIPVGHSPRSTPPPRIPAGNSPRSTPATALDMRTEAILAIREAEGWDWPLPPTMSRRLSPQKLFLPPRFDSLTPDSTPLIEAVQSRSPVFSCETTSSSRRDSVLSSSDELPRTNSSTLSSEVGPLTPDEAPDDPFGFPVPRAPQALRKHLNNSARFGVPF